jgi:hypothetical protein
MGQGKGASGARSRSVVGPTWRGDCTLVTVLSTIVYRMALATLSPRVAGISLATGQ